MRVVSEQKCFDGVMGFYAHPSKECGVEMGFAVFRPPQAATRKVPVVTYLAGLTCTEETFMIKAGAQRVAAELGLMLVAPDTSPRGAGLPGEDSEWDFGVGAGFYVDATQAPWKPNFQMEAYITEDLIAAIEANFPADPKRRGISGHSMGGHGALTLAMNHPHLYKSVSAFAPISSPSRAPWGQKAFAAYLGNDHAAWERHDAAILMAKGMAAPFDDILVDQGLSDPFLEKQLMPDLLEQAAATAGQKLTLRYHEGYDHSYYFIQSFIDDHIAFHGERLR